MPPHQIPAEVMAAATAAEAEVAIEAALVGGLVLRVLACLVLVPFDPHWSLLKKRVVPFNICVKISRRWEPVKGQRF